jgi:hypothetical protein
MAQIVNKIGAFLPSPVKWSEDAFDCVMPAYVGSDPFALSSFFGIAIHGHETPVNFLTACSNSSPINRSPENNPTSHPKQEPLLILDKLHLSSEFTFSLISTSELLSAPIALSPRSDPEPKLEGDPPEGPDRGHHYQNNLRNHHIGFRMVNISEAFRGHNSIAVADKDQK